jgi:transposase
MLYMGVDLGKKKSRIAVLDERGEVYTEVKVPNRKQTFQKFLKHIKEPVEMVCETGNKCFWLADLMQDSGVGVHVAHAYKVKLIAEARTKTDKVDARILAELLKARFIPEVYIPEQDIRTWREIFRGRSHIVRMRTQLYNRIHAILDRYGIEYETQQVRTKGVGSWIETLELPDPIKKSMQQYVHLIQEITEQVTELEKRLKEKIKLDDRARHIVELLESIPGIGWLSALALYLEIIDISRFKSAKKLHKYIGIVPGVHQSGEVHRGGRLTKDGNSLLRWMMVEDAWRAVAKDRYYDNLYERHKRKLGKTRAILPVTRALLYAVYQVWSQEKRYEEIFTVNRKVR